MKKRAPSVIFLFLALLFISSTESRAQIPAPEVKTYEALRRAISQTRAESRGRVEKAVEAERVREAWETGRLIDAHVLQHRERAGYDQQVISRLAADLGMSGRELYYSLQFYRAYSILPHASKLSWSEYRELLSVKDPQKRNILAERAEKEGWDRDRLRKEVKALKGSGPSDEESGPGAQEFLPALEPGKPGTYKIILARTGPYAGELALDLGFSNYMRLTEVVENAALFKEGDIVVFPEGESEEGGRENREADLYTYRAWVYRVLDGDTIEAVVDLGFGVTTTQTLRLRGIDTPEIQTRDGREAKAFVETVLVGLEEAKPSQPSVLIRTTKSDKYDRYLGDVFFIDKAGKQTYLNNLLLEKGHAVRVRD
ncbi:MAG: DUF1016 N-terminal domain-containing protein [Candidatus Omnitrophota bacterium]